MSIQEGVERAKSRATQFRSQFSGKLGGQLGGKLGGQLGGKLGGQLGGKLSGQLGSRLSGQKLGGGALMTKAKTTMNTMSRRMIERKPGIMSMVKEFKPGSRVGDVFGHTVQNPKIRDMSIEGTSAKLTRAQREGHGRGRDLSIVPD